MWEAIRQNRRRSVILIGVMGTILVLLGFVIGLVFYPDPLIGGGLGAAIAFAVWLLQLLIAFTAGDTVILASAKARKVTKAEAPQLVNVVEEMTIAAGLGRPPATYIIDDFSPNAFAIGQNPEKASVAVTTGLLKRLNRDELQGVIAHEIGHIINQDVRFMTIAAVMVGAIVLIADLFLRSLFFGAGSRRSSKGGGKSAAIIMVVAIILAILAPIVAQLLYFACSRRREYLADASAARFTRYPEGLASALEKISSGAGRIKDKKPNRAILPLYIINPLQARSAVGWNSTHPPTEKRINILRSMAGAGLKDYERAALKVQGWSQNLFSQKEMDETGHLEKRQGMSAGEKRKEQIARAREAADAIDRLADYLLIACPCGMRIKVPPEFKRKTIDCPRCSRSHTLPEAVAISAALKTALDKAGGEKQAAAPTKQSDEIQPLRFERKGKGWQSFRCPCGATVNLSPAFVGSQTNCPKCKRSIEVVGG